MGRRSPLRSPAHVGVSTVLEPWFRGPGPPSQSRSSRSTSPRSDEDRTAARFVRTKVEISLRRPRVFGRTGRSDVGWTTGYIPAPLPFVAWSLSDVPHDGRPFSGPVPDDLLEPGDRGRGLAPALGRGGTGDALRGLLVPPISVDPPSGV